MEDVEALMTIAQLAMGLAGFSSVVVTLNQRSAVNENEKYFFFVLITVTFTAIFMALVPLGIHHLGYVGASLWKICSTIMLTGSIVLIVLNTMAVPKSLKTRGHIMDARSLVSIATPLTLWLSQLMNIFSWPIEAGAFAYLFGLLLWRFSAGMVFVHVVVLRSEEWALSA